AGLDGDLGRRFTEGGENAPGVEPAGSVIPEDVVPVEITGFHLARGGVGAVGTADRPANAVAALGEVEAVADLAAAPVVFFPLDEAGIDPALENEVLDEPSHRVVRKSCHGGGAEPKTTAQSASDVVFSSSLPGGELACCVDTALARIEAEHDLAHGNTI